MPLPSWLRRMREKHRLSCKHLAANFAGLSCSWLLRWPGLRTFFKIAVIYSVGLPQCIAPQCTPSDVFGPVLAWSTPAPQSCHLSTLHECAVDFHSCMYVGFTRTCRCRAEYNRCVALASCPQHTQNTLAGVCEQLGCATGDCWPKHW